MSEKNRRSIVERALAIVTEVEPGEAPTALLLTLNVFIILTAYYIIKPVREALILTMESGAEYKAYAGAFTAVLFLVAVPAYSAFANRMARNRLILSVTFFFIACLVLFYLMGLRESLQSSIAIPFYLWVGIFNMMFVAQFWAFANDIYTEEQGERLFALIGVGASAGAALGSGVSAWLTKPPEFLHAIYTGIGVYEKLLVAAGLLVFTAVLFQVVHAREGGGKERSGEEAKRSGASRTRQATPERSGSGEEAARAEARAGGFSLVLANRYLMLLAAFHLIFTFVNTNGEYILGAIVSASAPGPGETLDGLAAKEWVDNFYSTFFLGVNVVGVALQAFVLSRLVKYGGIKLAFFVVPFIALGGAALIVILPMLTVVRISKTLENGSDYSINNTVRHMLWLPTTKDMKYKAKQAVDTFFVRMGDVSSGVLVFLGADLLARFTSFGGLGVRGFAVINILLIVVWLILGGKILQEQSKLRAQHGEAAASAIRL